MVLCCDPGAAGRGAGIRGQFLTGPGLMTGGSGALSAAGRARLSGVVPAGDGRRGSSGPQRAGCCASIALLLSPGSLAAGAVRRRPDQDLGQAR
jgi:hypothetical protein